MIIWWNKISSYQITFRIQKFSKRFISKLQTFTNSKVRFSNIWNTCKIQSLFNDTDKVQHLSCVIYKAFAIVVQIILENLYAMLIQEDDTMLIMFTLRELACRCIRKLLQ